MITYGKYMILRLEIAFIKGPEKYGKYSILDIYEVNKQLIITWGESFYGKFMILLN